MSTLINWLEAGRRLAERIPYSLVALVARFAAAGVFWRSGQTKVEGFFHIKENTFFLFREEYKVPLLPPSPPICRRPPSTFFRCCSLSGSPRGYRRSASWS
jgi:hypothetical protein